MDFANFTVNSLGFVNIKLRLNWKVAWLVWNNDDDDDDEYSDDNDDDIKINTVDHLYCAKLSNLNNPLKWSQHISHICV